jgi:Lsr2
MNAMARSVAVVVTDDLDGSPDAETVTFGLDGVTYEIDLSAKNRARLERDFAPYTQAGRRITRGRNRSQGRPAAPRIDRASVRAWAKENGLQVSERGRISADLMSQYEAAH